MKTPEQTVFSGLDRPTCGLSFFILLTTEMGELPGHGISQIVIPPHEMLEQIPLISILNPLYFKGSERFHPAAWAVFLRLVIRSGIAWRGIFLLTEYWWRFIIVTP
jgi:hypothetical protein